MTTNDAFKRFEELFNQEIGVKTGWGYLEVKTVFKGCMRLVLGEMVHAEEMRKLTDEQEIKIKNYKHALYDIQSTLNSKSEIETIERITKIYNV